MNSQYFSLSVALPTFWSVTLFTIEPPHDAQSDREKVKVTLVGSIMQLV